MHSLLPPGESCDGCLEVRPSSRQGAHAGILQFSGSDDDYEEDSSSEEGGNGPFNMVTETYISDEDYEDYDL